VVGSGTGAKVAETEAAEDTRDGGRGSPRWRIAARLAVVAAITAIVVVYHRDLFRSLGVLDRLRWTWFVLAIVAETASVLAFAFSRRRLLQASGRPPSRRAMVGISYAASAVSMSLPFAGTGLATLYSYRQFRRHGIDSATTGWTLAVSGIFSTSSLALLLVAGAIAGGGGVGAAIGFAGAAVYLVPGAAVLLAVRYERVRAALSRLVLRAAHGVHRLPRREATRARLDNFPARLEGFLDRIASIRLPARGYAAVFGLAVLNWAADCAALALAIVATGQPVPWHALLLAYGAGAAVGSTGLTPGGFGLVELTVAAALTAGGLSGSGALAAVLAYRIVNFWLVILTGWVIMLLLGDRPGAPAEAAGPGGVRGPGSVRGPGGNRDPYGPGLAAPAGTGPASTGGARKGRAWLPRAGRAPAGYIPQTGREVVAAPRTRNC
jgi:putative heme transporter